MKTILILLMGFILLTSCGNENKQSSEKEQRDLVYEDSKVYIYKIKLDEHDYFEIVVPDYNQIRLEHHPACQKCYDIFY